MCFASCPLANPCTAHHLPHYLPDLLHVVHLYVPTRIAGVHAAKNQMLVDITRLESCNVEEAAVSPSAVAFEVRHCLQLTLIATTTLLRLGGTLFITTTLRLQFLFLVKLVLLLMAMDLLIKLLYYCYGSRTRTTVFTTR